MTEEQENTLDQVLQDAGLTLEATFVPWEQSRNKHEKEHSLNWLITLVKKDGQRMTVDYMQGIAHVPGYQFHGRTPYDQRENHRLCRKSCRTGKTYRHPKNGHYNNHCNWTTDTIPPPKIKDVMYSLISDASVLDYRTYEEWASDFGYDPDSRSGEKAYQLCLQQSLSLKALIGWSMIEALRAAYQDY